MSKGKFVIISAFLILISSTASAAVWTLRTQINGSLEDVATFSTSKECGQAASAAKKEHPNAQFSCFKTQD